MTWHLNPALLLMRSVAVMLCCLAVANFAFAEEDRNLSALNISIAIFDPGIPADRSVHRDLQVFPRVREIEALYLPFVLRETLANKNEWGAVRVVPASDVAAELLVKGRIVKSDGEILELHVRVVDARGSEWIDQTFAGGTGDRKLYDDIANSLRSARAGRNDKELKDVVEISLLRYAQQLAPDAFDDYLSSNSDGAFTIERLPAINDPMLERIERIRGVEYVFTDAVDAKYRELSADVEIVYDVWREYRRKFTQYQVEEAERVQNARSDARRGSYEALLNSYETYKWDRQAAQEQESWAVGFENEVGPTITAIETRVAELEGWVEDRYAEWQRILAELFEVETELPDG